MAITCICSKPVNPSAPNSPIWEEEYCSTYCREYDARGLEPIRGDIKTGLKQMSGIFYMPNIDIPCDYCGVEFPLTSARGAESNAQFCSRTCFLQVSNLNIQRSLVHYTMIKILLHNRKFRDGWLSVSQIDEVMCRSRNFKSNSRRISQFLRLWVSRGLLEKKVITARHTEFRISNVGINNPIAKVFVEMIPKKVIK
tara:strand:+ start:1780 stop:2370 length:591 start_codon:yes stop_codon:yes gene_type:complete